MGYEMEVEGLIEPDEILWDNLGIVGTNYKLR